MKTKPKDFFLKNKKIILKKTRGIVLILAVFKTVF